MFITKKHLPRRAFLRGVGVTLGLPLLDSMVPAQTPLAKTAGSPPPRLAFIYFPHGAIMDQWTPAVEGSNFQFSPILKTLEPFRKQLTIVSGLGNKAPGNPVHATTPGTWLSGVAPRPTHDPLAGVTADQIAAQHIGQDTALPSLEFSTEEVSGSGGACDHDYGCSYGRTISFRTPTTPLPMEFDPRKAFERLFGQGSTAAERKMRSQQYGSILDAVSKQAADLDRTLGPEDRAMVSDYIESVREIERRVQKLGSQDTSHLELPEMPVGIPASFEEHIDLMFDLAALAYQTNITRIFSFMMCRELSSRTYGQIGVPDAFHPTSHHQNNSVKIAKLVKIQTYHTQLFARWLTKLQNMPDGDGTMLDHSIILYGSNMSNSNVHDHFPLPTAVISGAGARLKGGQHVRYPDRTPIANLLTTLLDKAGVPVDRLGDSTGKFQEL